MFDYIGQVPAEILSMLDIILQLFFNNDIFMGVLLVISTMEHTEIQYLNGKQFYCPPVLSFF